MKAVKEDGAEVLILGCAGMAGLDKEIEKIVGVPVIDAVVSAIMTIESFIRYRVSTSKGCKRNLKKSNNHKNIKKFIKRK